jgi:hypothetical protein
MSAQNFQERFGLEGRHAMQILKQRERLKLGVGYYPALDTLEKKTVKAEGVILEKALTKCITDRTGALKRLAEAARRFDKAAFGDQSNFGPAHQALLKVLDEAAEYIDP